MKNPFKKTNILMELIAVFCIFVFLLVLSYFFNVFLFIVNLFEKYPHLRTFLDEIIVGFLVIIISSTIFSLRRWIELKKEIVLHKKTEESLIISEKNLNETLEELKLSYKKLEKLDQMKSDFITIVSHELKTPLTSIKTAVTMLLNGVEEKYPTAGQNDKELLDIILANTDRQTRTITDLLDISKIEAGIVEMELKYEDILSVAKDVIRQFSFQAKEKNIKQNLMVSENIPLVLIDLEQMRRVFNNLIDNAIKFTPDNGEVTVKIEDAGTNIKITIKDTGIGISREDADELFDKFHRIIKPGTVKKTGTGLGLVIIKGIVEAHGGRVWIDLTCDKGACFCFTLPKQKRILVIDDDQDIQKTLRFALEAEGYHVSVASDGKEGLQKSLQEKPNLIILDLRLPKLPGEEVCRSIRKEESIKDTPIIMLTSKSSDADKVIGRVIGADCYIAKPFDLNELLKQIEGTFKIKKIFKPKIR